MVDEVKCTCFCLDDSEWQEVVKEAVGEDEWEGYAWCVANLGPAQYNARLWTECQEDWMKWETTDFIDIVWGTYISVLPLLLSFPLSPLLIQPAWAALIISCKALTTLSWAAISHLWRSAISEMSFGRHTVPLQSTWDRWNVTPFLPSSLPVPIPFPGSSLDGFQVPKAISSLVLSGQGSQHHLN